MRRLSWLELTARVGYAARGVVFTILGVFAALAAAGARTRAADSKDVIRILLDEPFGSVLVAVMAAGLLCFALWRLLQGLADAEHRGTNLKALMRRGIWTGSAIFYLGFAWIAFTMMLGTDLEKSGERVTREWTAWLLAQPFGPWIVGTVGLAFLTSSIGVAVRGLRADFEARLELGKERRALVGALGVAGFLTRAFVFALIGVFLVFAAINSRASEAKGFAGALSVIQRQPYGTGILALAAAGLVSFGIYCIAEAGYRRITPPKLTADT